MQMEQISFMNGYCYRIQIPVTPILQRLPLVVLDAELDELGRVCCLGWYRVGEAFISQFLFISPIDARTLAASSFFKYSIIGSNKVVCYYADHERTLFNLPKDIMIETMTRPYFPKELAIKLGSLDMVSAKYLPQFGPNTLHVIGCHNAGCIIKILLLLLGRNSYNRADFPAKFKRFLSQNIGGLDVGIPFTDMLTPIDLVIMEFVFADGGKDEIEYLCYYDFQCQFIRVVDVHSPTDVFSTTEVWTRLMHTAKFVSLDMALLRSVLHLPNDRYLDIMPSDIPIPSDYLSIVGLSIPSASRPSPFDRVFRAYAAVVKAALLFLMGSEFSGIHFKHHYYSTFKRSEVATCRT